MKFPKFKNYIRLPKAIAFFSVVFLINFSVFAQVPTKDELQNGQNLPAIPAQIDGVTPKGPAKNRTEQIKRVPTKGTGETRDITIAPTDAKAIEAEETNRLKKEAELADDEAKSKTLKRIFGNSIFSNTKLDLSALSNITTPGNYVLGPGDKLTMDIYGYSQFKQSSTINSDGYIVLEKAGVVSVSGLTIEEAENKIKNAFSKIFLGLNGGSGYPSNTYLKVSLTGMRTIKIKIAGEVIAPGTYTLTSFTSLLNALYACGGPNEIGTFRDIKLIRNNKIVSTLDIYEILTKGFSKGDMLLKDQDIIYIGPFLSRIAIDGFIKRPGLFELMPNEKIADAIKYAGGFNQYAYTERLKVYRNTTKDKRIVDVTNEEFNIASSQNGDSIVVEKILERLENMVSVSGAVFRPGEYSLDVNQTIMKLIASAEGLKEESLLGRVNVIRTNEDLSISNISINLDDIKTNRIGDFQLKRLDKVVIPSIFDLTEVSFVKIQGAINSPDAIVGVEIPYVKNMTVKDLLIKVGGLTEAAALSKVEIVRRKRNVDPKQIDAQISEIIEFEIAPDLSYNVSSDKNILLPYDEIFIRTSPNYVKQNFVSIGGEVIYPGKYGVKFKDEKISDLISRAGGISPQSYLKGATMVRKTKVSDFQRDQREEVLNSLNINTRVKKAQENLDDPLAEDPTIDPNKNNNLITESVGIDLEKILKNPGSIDDLILQDGDEIIVPKKLQTVRIAGEILYPTTVKFLPEMKFVDYVSRSGGFTKKSARGKAFVIYPNGSVDRTRKFLFVKIYPKVEPGSEIIVPGKTETAQGQFSQVATLLTTLTGIIGTIVTTLGLIQLNKNR